ncbi:heavy-metal-associated domain-containing protein [Halobacillus massiliensis]|uniref:heavy-metal-associated domain-containing protein n=1 Tax=Halobacillus massiliensis TaxID=1926286 RepID=UPI0009E4C1DB|nr:cation transporter [Halobacillus massiliensis]
MQLTLQVNGMTGNECEKKVKEALTLLEGVYGTQIDVDSGRVEVTYDESFATKDMMKEAVKAQGYEPVG